MRIKLAIAGLMLAVTAGGSHAGPRTDGGMAIGLVRADYGAALRYWDANGAWSSRGGEVRLALRDGRVARWRIAFPLGRTLTDAQLRALSGPRGVIPENANARRVSALPALGPPGRRDAVALSARLLSLHHGVAHVSWVPIYATDADFAWRGGRNDAFLRGLALGRRDPPLARGWVRLAHEARVVVPPGGTPVVLLRWREAGATTLRGVTRRPVDAITA